MVMMDKVQAETPVRAPTDKFHEIYSRRQIFTPFFFFFFVDVK